MGVIVVPHQHGGELSDCSLPDIGWLSVRWGRRQGDARRVDFGDWCDDLV